MLIKFWGEKESAWMTNDMRYQLPIIQNHVAEEQQAAGGSVITNISNMDIQV